MIFESEITYIEGTPYLFEYSFTGEDGIEFDEFNGFFRFEIMSRGTVVFNIIINSNPFIINLPFLISGLYRYRILRTERETETIQFGKIRVIDKLQ